MAGADNIIYDDGDDDDGFTPGFNVSVSDGGEEGSFPCWKIFPVYSKQTELGAFFSAQSPTTLNVWNLMEGNWKAFCSLYQDKKKYSEF